MATRLRALILGVLTTLLLSEGLLRAFQTLAHQQLRTRLRRPPGSQLRILALGDSATSAGGVNSWPCQLQAVLGQALPGVSVAVYNAAGPGYTSDRILEHLDENLTRYRPHVVLAMMGANDNGAFLPFTPERRRGLPAGLAGSRLAGLMALAWDRLHPSPPNTLGEPLQARTSGLPDADLLEEHPRHPLYQAALESLMRGESQQAQGMLEQAMRLDPSDPRPSVDLAALELQVLATRSRALDRLQQVCQKWPKEAFFHVYRGMVLQSCGQPQMAQAAFASAVGGSLVHLCHNQQCLSAYLNYLELNRLDAEAERVFACAERNVLSPNLLGNAYIHWMIRQRLDLADYYRQTLRRFLGEFYNERARENHRALAQRSKTHGFVLVCPYYANRSSEPLRRFFADQPEVTVVDNLEPFRTFVESGRYSEMFRDRSYTTAGHGTDLANYDLAIHVARALFAQGLGDVRRLPAIAGEPGP